jgi:hypothetical protein
VETGRARREFTMNCRTVERVALGGLVQPMAELDGAESIKVLTALKQDTFSASITLPFVRPENVAEFYQRLGRDVSRRIMRLSKSTESGFLVLHAPFTLPAPSDIPQSGTTLSGTNARPDPATVPRGLADATAEEPEHVSELVRRVRRCLLTGNPLVVTYLQHQVIPKALRRHLYAHFEERVSKTYQEVVRYDTLWCILRWLFGNPLYRTKEETKKENERIPATLLPLRVGYGDGTEGMPFPCYSLDPIGMPATIRFYRVKIGLVSMRHREVDGMVARYLLRNRELQTQCTNSSEQELFAFERTIDLVTKLMRVIQHDGNATNIDDDVNFRVLIDLLDLRKVRAEGLELHLFQTTGFQPAIMGAWRAIATLLPRYRKCLVVVPRILTRRVSPKIPGFLREERIREADYAVEEPWF